MFGPLFHSYVLAQVFGLYFVIMAIIMLSRVSYYRELIATLIQPTVGMMVGTSFGLLLGLLLIIVHNIWVLEPRVIITLIGWLIVIKSILWLAVPEAMVRLSKQVYSGSGYYFTCGVMLLIGIFLMTKGFYLWL